MKNIFIVIAFVTVGAVGYTGYNFYQSSVKTEEMNKTPELVIVKPAIKDNFTIEAPADIGKQKIGGIIKALNDGDFATAKRKVKQAFVWTDTDEKVILEFRLNGSQWEYIEK